MELLNANEFKAQYKNINESLTEDQMEKFALKYGKKFFAYFKSLGFSKKNGLLDWDWSDKDENSVNITLTFNLKTLCFDNKMFFNVELAKINEFIVKYQSLNAKFLNNNSPEIIYLGIVIDENIVKECDIFVK